MPIISRFYGIVIRMYFNDHNPPHFHAAYGGDEVLIEIDDLSIMTGRLSGRATGLVEAWARQHQAELMENWERMRAGRPPELIEPLD